MSMKISNDIVVGLSFMYLCNFYENIHEYTRQLNKNKPSTKKHTLIGLKIEVKNEIVYENYYVQTKTNIVKFVFSSFKFNDKFKYNFESKSIIKKEEAQKEIMQSQHTVTVDDYIKMN